MERFFTGACALWYATGAFAQVTPPAPPTTSTISGGERRSVVQSAPSEQATRTSSGLPLTSTSNTLDAAQTLAGGPSAISPLSRQAIDWIFAEAADRASLVDSGGIWNDGNFVTYGFNKAFGPAYSTATNNVTTFIQAEATGSRAAVLPAILYGSAKVSNSTIFGLNVIAQANPGVSNVKLVGQEIDVEPSIGVVPTSDSGGLYINIFSSPISGPALQIGGVSGGTFGNGLVIGGLASTGSGLAGQTGETMGSLMNASAARYTKTAIILGSGVSQGISFGSDGGATAPLSFGDNYGNLVTTLGSSGSVVIRDHSGKNNLDTVQATTPRSARHTIAGILQLTPYTVAELRSADPLPAQGDIGIVTDAATCMKNNPITGGGVTFCTVVYNSVWVGI